MGPTESRAFEPLHPLEEFNVCGVLLLAGEHSFVWRTSYWCVIGLHKLNFFWVYCLFSLTAAKWTLPASVVRFSCNSWFRPKGDRKNFDWCYKVESIISSYSLHHCFSTIIRSQTLFCKHSIVQASLKWDLFYFYFLFIPFSDAKWILCFCVSD